jgi:hypothetical protein
MEGRWRSDGGLMDATWSQNEWTRGWTRPAGAAPPAPGEWGHAVPALSLRHYPRRGSGSGSRRSVRGACQATSVTGPPASASAPCAARWRRARRASIGVSSSSLVRDPGIAHIPRRHGTIAPQAVVERQNHGRSGLGAAGFRHYLRVGQPSDSGLSRPSALVAGGASLAPSEVEF